MKKVFLSLAMIATLTVVSCKSNEAAPVEEAAVEAVEAVEATTEAAVETVDSTANEAVEAVEAAATTEAAAQ